MSKLLQYNGIRWIEIAKNGISGQNGENGKTPIKGVDYFTSQEKEDFVKQVKDLLNMDEILKQLKELRLAIESLKRNDRLGAGTIHRGGIKMYVAKSIGTGDGTAGQSFTLPSPPYDATQITIHVGGSAFFPTTDFTVSASIITMVAGITLPNGSAVLATYQGT